MFAAVPAIPETQHTRYECDDQKNHCPAQHAVISSVIHSVLQSCALLVLRVSKKYAASFMPRGRGGQQPVRLEPLCALMSGKQQEAQWHNSCWPDKRDGRTRVFAFLAGEAGAASCFEL